MKLEFLFRRRWLLMYLPILLACVALLWMSFAYWLPMPPQKIRIAAGRIGDSHTQTALRYRDHLNNLGINTEIIVTEVSRLALKALQDDPPRADLAMVSGLYAPAPETKPSELQIRGLTVIEREPIWLLANNEKVKQLSGLRGMRVGLSQNSPVVKRIFEQGLKQAQLTLNDLEVVETPRLELADSLLSGKVDAIVILASINHENIRLLTRQNNIQIIGFEKIYEIAKTEPHLHSFVMPQGSIEYRGNIPSNDVALISSNLQLVIRKDMHPALQRAILDIAQEMHEAPTFLQRESEFPNSFDLDFPISDTALSAIRGNKPWLEMHLPYGQAQFAQWFFLAFLPIVICTVLLLRIIPTFFKWRINALLQNFYGELKFLESEIDITAAERPIDLKRLIQRIDAIEMQVMQLELPTQFTYRWYTLRSHLADARERLLDLRAR